MTNKFTSWVSRNMPTRESMEHNRFLRPFAHRVMRSELWRFTRRSVPRGVALGMLIGIIIPFAQIFFAALLSFTVRANVPVAAVTTFVTNPLTTPLIWVFSYKVGSSLLHIDASTGVAPVTTALEHTDFDQVLQWLTGATLVTAFGLVVVAIVASALSYLVTGWGWRVWIGRKRTRHLAHRARRASPAE
jgi:uncharacterized protein (DUF2062 family)